MKHMTKQLPERICPKCGATEGVVRIFNYYDCEACYKTAQVAKLPTIKPTKQTVVPHP